MYTDLWEVVNLGVIWVNASPDIKRALTAWIALTDGSARARSKVNTERDMKLQFIEDYEFIL